MTKMIISTVLLVAAMFCPDGIIKTVFFLASYLSVGGEIIIKAVKNLFKLKIFDEHFLMGVATIGAIALGEYTEAVAVMLFYQIGEYFQDKAVDSGKESIEALVNMQPAVANIFEDGKITEKAVENIEIGETIVVKAGERIPVDGVIISGGASIDTSALTGESLPVSVYEGSEVMAGCVNLDGSLKIRAAKIYKESSAAKIIDLIETAAEKKAKSEKFITKFAKIYTPTVVIFALALAVIASIITKDPTTWCYRALLFLVISCPCALVLSVPLSFFSGITKASKEGILIKGSNYLELLAKTKCVIFDKTGTLTNGKFQVDSVNCENSESLIYFAAHAEAYSKHPLAQAVTSFYGKPVDFSQIENYSEIAGMGVTADVGGEKIAVGNKRFVESLGVRPDNWGSVHVCKNDEYLGSITFSDTLKENSKKLIKKLKSRAVKTVMLTGDSSDASNLVATKLQIDEVFSQLMPADKVSICEKIINETNGATVYVGDGINDAPAIRRSDVGIAMGAFGSDAAIDAADVVIMGDDVYKIVRVIETAKSSVSRVKQNIFFSLVTKAVILILGALGFANMWLAVIADVGVAAIATLNALRK